MNVPHYVAGALLVLFASASPSAEYRGNDLDGESYPCTAFSYSTSKYYPGICEFDGDDVILHFPRGGSLRLTLDDEEIDDPSSIDAFDYKNGNFWELEVDL